MEPNTIYNRFDSAHGWEQVDFRADRILQSAELNELQSIQRQRLRDVADVLFKEGDIIRACQCITDAVSGATTVQGGALYIAGAVRGIAPAQLTVPPLGTTTVGAYLQTSQRNEQTDPSLYNPAAGTRGYGEAGAERKIVTLTWGVQGDGTAGTYYPVWTIVDGHVMPKEPPPNIDAVTQALARYDRDSAGGTYVVRGLDVVMGADLPGGQQVYTVREGVARINGHALELAASRRLVYNAQPNLQRIDSEPHLSSTEAAQRIPFDRTPAVGLPQVRIQARKTVQLTHGGFTGAADPLPDDAVLQIESITQGGTTYQPGSDYKLAQNQVDWSAAGAEPNPGSTYQATYVYMTQATPTDVDATGFTVAGALTGTLIHTTYDYAQRRYDRLVMTDTGTLQWIAGVPAPWAPKPPSIPTGVLPLATVYQSWDALRRCDQDAVRVVPMQTLKAYQDHLQSIYADLAELRLSVDASGRHSGIKKGLFADPMLGNDLRDAGQPQTAHILGGHLQLPMTVALHQIGLGIHTAQTTDYAAVPVLAQTGRTASMLVNPYSAFDPLPRQATITPAVDYWTDVDTLWANPLVQRLTPTQAVTAAAEILRSEATSQLEHLRQIDIAFDLDFPPGETLAGITFDGIAVAAQPLPNGSLVADAQGLRGSFTIPPGVPAGSKNIVFTGQGGNRAEAVFTGQGTLLERTVSKVTVQLYDPLAQTFTLDNPREICGVNLWFTDAGTSDVQVQLREVVGGVPSRAIVAECVLHSTAIAPAGQPTTASWAPLALEAGVEYAIVILTNDPACALAVAELGGWDEHRAQYITSQPYSVGVLLSSSNASTWTPHQGSDLTFELLAAEHSTSPRTIDLGTVTVEDATDLMVQAGVVLPAAAAAALFSLQLEGGQVHQVAAGQAVQLPSRYSGTVQVQAQLSGNTHHSAHLLPGLQLVDGSVQPQGDYITPAINAGDGVTLHVVLQAALPAGSAVTVQMQASDQDTWAQVPFIASSPQSAGVLELTYRLDGISAQRLRVRLLLTGSHSARPLLTNLRAIVL